MNKSEIYSSAFAKYLWVSDCQYKIPVQNIFVEKWELSKFLDKIAIYMLFKLKSQTLHLATLKSSSPNRFFWPLIHIQRNPVLPIIIIRAPSNQGISLWWMICTMPISVSKKNYKKIYTLKNYLKTFVDSYIESDCKNLSYSIWILNSSQTLAFFLNIVCHYP